VFRDVVIVGAGPFGLAMSWVLAGLGIDHVVLERGEVAERWRSARWQSLRLLTPNWMTRLPGRAYAGADPDGYMRAHELAEFVAGYAHASAAPVRTQTTVTSVRAEGDGHRVDTNRGSWRCLAVVLATGACALPVVPALAAAVPPAVAQLTARDYRQPADLHAGRVLVVGASATGVQLAREIRRSGRPVTLAAGEHVRLPRAYRGRDIQAWMHDAGVLDQRIDEVDDVARARRVPSPQLVGEHATLDLNALQAEGVELVGRLAAVRDGRALFSGSLRNVCALADLKMNRLLDTIDVWAVRNGWPDGTHARLGPTRVPDSPRLALDLGRDVQTVLWATGFRPDFGFLQAPVFTPDGALRHDQGVVAPGLYVLGLPFLRRRKSSFIHGAEDDARALGAEIAAHLERSAAAMV
jgi:putative flavoprotein involved in K+ transport